MIPSVYLGMIFVRLSIYSFSFTNGTLLTLICANNSSGIRADLLSARSEFD